MKHVNHRIYKTILPLFLGLLLSLGASAQQKVLTGKVTDASGEPLPGVSIMIEGTTTGTATDVYGNYTLNVQNGNVLVFSFIGYKPQTITITNQTTLNVVLQEDVEQLEEVVVIGYGTVKKNDATGSVTSVKADQLNKGAITNPVEMLKGKSSGVLVVPGGGQPGESSTIRIRGGSSLKASNDPLVVIDGLPVSNTGIDGVSDPLSAINPSDIETFTVLKDASATAIYGSRASNGVIVITTKKGSQTGKGGRPHISLDATASISYNPEKIDVMNASKLREVVKSYAGEDSDAYRALGDADTDWQDEIYRVAYSQDVNLSATGSFKIGGEDVFPYRVSVGYTNENGILKRSNMGRTTASINLSPTFFGKHLTVNVNAKVMDINNTFANKDAIGAAVRYDPTQPIYDDTERGLMGYHIWRTPDQAGGIIGTPNKNGTLNPVAALQQKEDKSDAQRVIGNVQLDYKFHFLPDLRANLNLGLDLTKSDGKKDTPEGCEMSYHENLEIGSGQHENYSQLKRDHSLEFYLNYAKDIKSIRSRIDVMAGYSWQHFYMQKSDLKVKQNDHTAILYSKDEKTENYLISFFGRLNYTLMDRYMLTFTLRDDGTSRFQNNKWGLFPSVALAWRMINESWLKESAVLSDLKLRLSYGVTGQQDLNAGDYPSIPTYKYALGGSLYQFGNDVITPITPLGYASDLKWEETTTYNGGLDFGFLNNRISGSIDAYYRKTKDLINFVPVSAGTNLTNYITTNVGDLENTGVEFSIDAKPVLTNNWEWDLGFNVSWNKNKITKLTASDNPDYLGVETGGIAGAVGNNVQLHQVGSPTNSFYLLEQIYDANGRPIEGAYVDRNKDGQINDKDKHIFKKPAPDVFFGYNTSLSWKNLTLAVAGHASLGNYVYNNMSSNGDFYSDLWTNTFIANRMSSATKANFTNAQYMSDYYVQNASFFKIDNITLAYMFKNIAKTDLNLRIYATVQNVCTITNYDGIDPEISNGIDNNMYPRPRTFLLGLNINF